MHESLVQRLRIAECGSVYSLQLHDVTFSNILGGEGEMGGYTLKRYKHQVLGLGPARSETFLCFVLLCAPLELQCCVLSKSDILMKRLLQIANKVTRIQDMAPKGSCVTCDFKIQVFTQWIPLLL